MNRPEITEYAPYFHKIITLVEEGDFFELLDANTNDTMVFFKSIPTEAHNHKYAEDKWTIKQVLMHLIDTERSFAFRAFVCMRGDSKTILYGMDEVSYAANVSVENQTMAQLLREFQSVRKATCSLFANITETQSRFSGNTTGHSITARALGFLMIGHIKHHINIINERYLVG
ncbi:MAG: hypothetical protein RLZZ292_1718 [Bacteroidota bacterium]|jgi:uncharacterized damage-inducible protein DinB